MATRTASQRVGDSAEHLCKGVFLNSKDWISRDQTHDFGMDFEAELVAPSKQKECLTGRIIKLQVKGTKTPNIRNNAVYLRLKIDFLKYVKNFKIPVVLLVADISKGQVYYLWLQEYLLSNPIGEQRNKTILVKVPLRNKLEEGILFDLPNIAKGDTDTARMIAFQDLVEVFSSSEDYEVFRSLLKILKSYQPEKNIELLEKKIDELVELGLNVPFYKALEYGRIISEICRIWGDRISKETIIRMLVRGDVYSRAGVLGLSALYDKWPDDIESHGLAKYFDHNSQPQLAWYCRFREYHKESESMSFWLAVSSDIRTNFPTELGELEISTEHNDYLAWKWPIRGDSVLLDCLSLKEKK